MSYEKILTGRFSTDNLELHSSEKSVNVDSVGTLSRSSGFLCIQRNYMGGFSIFLTFSGGNSSNLSQ